MMHEKSENIKTQEERRDNKLQLMINYMNLPEKGEVPFQRPDPTNF